MSEIIKRNSQATEADIALPLAWAYVFILTLANMISFVDRQVLALLVEPIKSDLSLSDTQIGLLQGLAFALFYSVIGVPLARIADRRSRKWVVTLGISCWSVATSCCGLAQSFFQLAAARVSVAVGEATLSPSAYSILADCFPRARRGLPLGLYSTGASAGMGLSLLIGAVVLRALQGVDIPGFATWQLVFISVAALGAIPIVAMLLLPEPPRREAPLADQPGPKTTLARTFRDDAATYIPLFLSHGFISLVAFSCVAWGPTYLIRIHAMTPQQVGFMMGPTLVVGGILGSLAGGVVADLLDRRQAGSGKLKLLIGAAMLLPITGLASLIDQSAGAALVGFGLTFLIGAATIAPVVAMIQEIAPAHSRAQISALFLLATNLLGPGAGPFLVGAITDRGFGGPEMVGRSLALVSVVAAIFAIATGLLAQRAYQRRQLRIPTGTADRG